MTTRKPQVKPSEVARNEKGQILPGASGNPGGQPKWVGDVRDLLRSDAPRAREVLREVLDTSEDDGDRIKAAEVVLSYTLPKPKLTIEHEHKAPTKTLAELGMSDEEICALARQALEKTK